MLKASTEDYERELKLLAHHIQEAHKELFKSIQENILLEVELPEGGGVNFLISSSGINLTSDVSQAKHVVNVSYRDLMRLVENPSKIVSYVLKGRVRIRGDYKTILSTLQKLL